MNKKIFIHVDMNAFFASIEQRDYPDLVGKPVAVTNGKHGSCIITSSYEARAFGIKTGMKIRDGRKICPYLVQRPSRPKIYADTSAKIMNILQNITPDIQIYSVDEAFLELTHCMKIYKEISYVVYKIKDLIYQNVNLKCSIGVSFSKSLAKYASKINKPDGITYITKKNYHKYLDNSSIDTLCGVSRGIKNFLNNHNVYKCSDMKNLPISILANRFGNVGRKIWLMANGNDFEGLTPDPVHPKSLGHGKVLMPNTKSRYLIKKIFLRMSNKLSLRLRKSNYESNIFLIGIKIKAGWVQKKIKLEKPTCNQSDIFNACLFYFNLFDKNIGIFQVQVTALNPVRNNIQMDIFNQEKNENLVLEQALDNISDKFGPNAIKPARLMSDDKDSPDVIAPAWRPVGYRKSV
jgi:DNA polymerase-4